MKSLPKQSNILWFTPYRPWSRMNVDHFHKICLIAGDSLSRYIECEIVSSTSVSESIERCVPFSFVMDCVMCSFLIMLVVLLRQIFRIFFALTESSTSHFYPILLLAMIKQRGGKGCQGITEKAEFVRIFYEPTS